MAPTNKASTKKKAAVVAKKSQEVKVRLNKSIPLPAAKPLADDWPVTSRPPTLKPTDSALRPGSLLQEICNGQDIHLNKQALQAPIISKEKGRYLLILPGNMSFRGLKSTTQSVEEEAMEGKSSTQESVEEGAVEEGEDIVKKKEHRRRRRRRGRGGGGGQGQRNIQQSQCSTVRKSRRIEYCQSQTSNSLSRFNQITRLSGNKGEYVIKVHVAQLFGKEKGDGSMQAIVFGAPSWETTGEEVAGDVVAPCSRNVVDDDAWMHYGGSERTLDGVLKGSKKKKSLETSQPAMVPIVSKEPIFDERGIPKPSRMSIHTAKPTPSKPPATTDVEGLSDASDDDDFEMKAELPLVKERTVPKRQASTKRRPCTSDLLDSDVEEEFSSEGEERNEVMSKSRRATQKSKDPLIPTADESSDVTEKVAKRTPHRRKSPSESSDDDDFSIANNNELSIPTSARRLSSRSSAKKTSYKEKEESDEESAAEDSTSNDAPKERKIMSGGRRSSAPKKSFKEKVDCGNGDNSPVETAAKKRKLSSGGRQKSDPIDLAGDDVSRNHLLATTKTGSRGAKTTFSTSAKLSRKGVPASVLEGFGRVTSVSSGNEKNTKSSRGRKSKSDSLGTIEKGDENQSEVINIDEQVSARHKAPTKTEKPPSIVPKQASGMESPSISSMSSPFRARRRKSPGVASAPKASSAKRSVFDLTGEFQFE